MKRIAVVVSGVVAVSVVAAAVLVTASASPRGGAAREVVPLSTPTRTLVDDGTIRSRLDGPEPLTWVFVGDSITHGSSHTDGRRSFVEHFAERVRTEMGRVGDVVINTGVSGDRTQEVLADFDARVRRFDPDVVVVMLGTNDSVDGPAGREGFRSRLGEITTRVRAAGAVPVLQTPNAVDTAASPGHADLGAYADVVRGLAATEHIVLVDHHARWRESGSGTAPEAWLSDDIHPNATGHLEMARTLFGRLGVLDPTSPTGGADWAADWAAEPLDAGEEMSERA